MSNTIFYHKILGFFSKQHKWAPSITYLHRRFILLRRIHLLKNCNTVLEIGSGSGSILAEINKIYPKINTYALEKSKKARALIKSFSPHTSIINDLNTFNKKFDAVIFFEVMEHVRNDSQFLDKIKSILKKDGLIIFSVPAHKKKWSVSYVWAGHYRRYEKKDLINLTTIKGFKIKSFNSYGFPICNLVSFVSRFVKKQKTLNIKDRKILNEESGVHRNAEVFVFKILNFLPLSFILHLCLYIQLLFLKKDSGIGYFVIAKKASD